MYAFLPLLLLFFLPSCSYIPSVPYKIDIQQGNVVTEEMVAKLKPGMTRSQVRFALGTPLIVDTFHRERWDYVFRSAPSGRVSEEQKLTVFFKDDRLSHIQGDFPQPPAFSEPSQAAPAFGETFAPLPGTDSGEDKGAGGQGTIDFLKQNQANPYKDNR